jgi:hypothetical protein
MVRVRSNVLIHTDASECTSLCTTYGSKPARLCSSALLQSSGHTVAALHGMLHRSMLHPGYLAEANASAGSSFPRAGCVAALQRVALCRNVERFAATCCAVRQRAVLRCNGTCSGSLLYKSCRSACNFSPYFS